MLAIIGGTGLYHLDHLSVIDTVEVDTPFGPPSGPIVRAELNGQSVCFLPRHGRHHQFLPHEVNYRANIYALKVLGVSQILAVSAVGSLREHLQPGQLVLASQYIDLIKYPREKTFFGGGLSAHISTAEPACPDMTRWVQKAADKRNLLVHSSATYAAVDGPRLGTKAESEFLRTIGADLVGMTQVPEVFLAREAQINYLSLNIVTDYDCWRDDDHASIAAIMARFNDTLDHVRGLLSDLVGAERAPVDDTYRRTLEGALMVRRETLSPDKAALLDVLSA
jgi:5'-methylthioadenosine phosphorylase